MGVLERVRLIRAIADPVKVMQASGMEPDEWQAAFLRSKAPQRAVLCSRQSGKTESATALMTWRALVRPGSTCLWVSPTQRQAVEGVARCRAHLLALGVDLAANAATSLRLADRWGGSRIIGLPGTAGSTRGYTATGILCIDEAAWVADETYAALRPTLAVVPDPLLVVMSTPNGKQGWFFEEFANGGPSWFRTKVTFDKVSRISSEYIERERASLPATRFRAEFLCEFISPAGAVFHPEVLAAAGRQADESDMAAAVEAMWGTAA